MSRQETSDLELSLRGSCIQCGPPQGAGLAGPLLHRFYTDYEYRTHRNSWSDFLSRSIMLHQHASQPSHRQMLGNPVFMRASKPLIARIPSHRIQTHDFMRISANFYGMPVNTLSLSSLPTSDFTRLQYRALDTERPGASRIYRLQFFELIYIGWRT